MHEPFRVFSRDENSLRGQWDFDEEAQEQVTRSLGVFGMVETENLYEEPHALLFGREEGAFIALRASLRNRRNENVAKYPYLATFCLKPYVFNFVVPDFISVMLFCQEFRQLVSEQNMLLKP
mgnify:CR=1 FL=1